MRIRHTFNEYGIFFLLRRLDEWYSINYEIGEVFSVSLQEKFSYNQDRLATGMTDLESRDFLFDIVLQKVSPPFVGTSCQFSNLGLEQRLVENF